MDDRVILIRTLLSMADGGSFITSPHSELTSPCDDPVNNRNTLLHSSWKKISDATKERAPPAINTRPDALETRQ
jgi:hypothetical protein